MHKQVLTLIILLYTESVLSANLACGKSSALKTITIESPASVPTDCSYTIKPFCTKICQLRVELEEFNLAPQTTIGNGPRTCNDDIFSAKGVQLCGVNNKQHFYITSTNAKAVTLSLKLANRVENPTLATPKWKITIIQLECPTGILGRSLLDNDGDDATAAADETNNLVVQPRATSVADGYYLAPIGCLQYFPDANGTIESFNFNNGIGPYFSNFQYSICFGRGQYDTFVRLTPVFFKLWLTNPQDKGIDKECYAAVQMIGRHEDYLFLPYATLADGRRGTQFCGSSLATDYVDIKPPGPFVVNVVSDDYYDATTDIGFKFNYQIL